MGWENDVYTVAESPDGDSCVLLCVTLEDVQFAFYLDTEPYGGTAQGIIASV